MKFETPNTGADAPWIWVCLRVCYALSDNRGQRVSASRP